jgi:hypothetical protein
MEPNPLVVIFNYNFYSGKELPKIFGYICNFLKNCPKYSIAQEAKIRPNLVTLIATYSRHVLVGRENPASPPKPKERFLVGFGL